MKIFNVISNAYYSDVKQFLCDLLESDNEAELLTQEVFIQLWAKREKIDTDGYLCDFLFGKIYELLEKELRIKFEKKIFDVVHS